MGHYFFVYGSRTVAPCLLLYAVGRVVVEVASRTGDSPLVPTITDLLQQYRDRTGDSYEDMARKVGNEITRARMHSLATAPPREFPKNTRTIELLADLLQMSIATIVLSFAAGLGLDVPDRQPLLAITLPPGTDNLTDRDRAAVRAVISSLVEARRAAGPPALDLSLTEGFRIAADDSVSQQADGTRADH